MTVALFAALLLILGAMKVCFWLNERLVKRQASYDATRVKGGQWDEPSEKLHIFQ